MCSCQVKTCEKWKSKRLKRRDFNKNKGNEKVTMNKKRANKQILQNNRMILRVFGNELCLEKIDEKLIWKKEAFLEAKSEN